MAWVALGMTIIAAVVLHKTVFGRTVVAIGQNRKASIDIGTPFLPVSIAVVVVLAGAADREGFTQ